MENSVDFMTFINKMNKISKKKRKSEVIKEAESSDNLDENEIVTNKDIGEEDSETKDTFDKKDESTSTEENLNYFKYLIIFSKYILDNLSKITILLLSILCYLRKKVYENLYLLGFLYLIHNYNNIK